MLDALQNDRTGGVFREELICGGPKIFTVWSPESLAYTSPPLSAATPVSR